MLISTKRLLTRLILLATLVVTEASTATSTTSSQQQHHHHHHHTTTTNNKADYHNYGVDVSFPMHHATVSDNYEWLPHNANPTHYRRTPSRYENMVIQPLGNQQAAYNEMMEGCFDTYGAERCRDYEIDRVAMNLRQPQSMQNYTEMGFQKIKTPPEVWELIQTFWNNNRHSQKTEHWPKGNTYTNHWKAETRMVNIEDRALRGGGRGLKEELWKAAKSTISEWTGEELTECSLYGIRIYTRGSVLSSHVDRLPLVSSAIINVDSDLEEPWPLEVIGHDGRAHNVTMEPGDMVLYESHSIIHGRPFPLKGEFVANLFVHFEPTGHSLRHHEENGAKFDGSSTSVARRGLGGHENTENNNGLPPYLIPGSPEESNWRSRHEPKHAKRNEQDSSSTTGSMVTTAAHHWAQRGDIEQLKQVLNEDKSLLHARDQNGWTPFHEAVRSGSVETAKFLHQQGANIHERTHKGRGGTALYFSKDIHGPNHEMTRWLTEIGASDIGPEL